MKLIVCVTLLFVTDVAVCIPDYRFNWNAYGWFKLHPVPATWQDAFMTCHYEGAVLASPINSNLDIALRDMMSNSEMDTPIHLGVNAIISQNSRGDFFSVEGVPLADLIINWGTYGKGKTPENCLSLGANGKTYITSCELSLPYICYKKWENTTNHHQCGIFDDDYHFEHATGSCYKHHKKSSTWITAHKICSAEGGHLVIINDQREADLLVNDYLDPPSGGNWGEAVHIGLRDVNKDHTWLTVHGQKIENVFNTWHKGQPDHRGNYNCGIFWGQGTLDDVNCDHPMAEYSFICEKPANNTRFENIFPRL